MGVAKFFRVKGEWTNADVIYNISNLEKLDYNVNVRATSSMQNECVIRRIAHKTLKNQKCFALDRCETLLVLNSLQLSHNIIYGVFDSPKVFLN